MMIISNKIIVVIVIMYTISIVVKSFIAKRLSINRSYQIIKKPLTISKAKGNNNDDKKKYTKSNLPSKICIVCNRPFEYRKKWAKVWDEVKYCSDRCRGQRNSNNNNSNSNNIERKNNLLPIQSRSLSSLIRKSMITLSVSLSLSLNVNANNNNNHPTKEELHNVFAFSDDDESFIDEENLLDKENYRRLNEANDDEYYKEARFTEHIDKYAVNSLINFHDKIFKETAKLLYNDENHLLSILDLCASHVSHLPSNYNKDNSNNDNSINTIVGIGMNKEELDANPVLSKNYVIDLNKSSKIPLPENSFDVVLLQLSVDYLIHPIDVIKEASRVLRPNGKIIISFSNRLFFDKAIANWTGKSDIEHIELVGRYILASKAGLTNPIVIDIQSKVSNGDPLYAVISSKK